jgi:predicted outer membrane repeat protein
MREVMARTKRGRRRSVLFVGIVVLLAATACTRVEIPPQAQFAYTPHAVFSGLTVTFSAAGSVPADEEIASYAWRFGDGSTGQGRLVEHRYTRPGSYGVQLTITTTGGQQAHLTRSIEVQRGLVVPTTYSTIQSAIDAARDGEAVIVLPGTYAETIAIRGKNITVQSRDPEDDAVVRTTVIRGSEYGRATVTIGDGSEATVAGFTLYIGPQAGDVCPTCQGIVYIREAAPTLRRNRILDSPNSGIVIYESAARIEQNTLVNNQSNSPGGAIVVDSYLVAPRISHNHFEGNTAPSGGAVFITASAATVIDPAIAAMTVVSGNTFRNNTATLFGGGAIFVEYVGNLYLGSPDTNDHSGNTPDDVFYIVPPAP